MDGFNASVGERIRRAREGLGYTREKFGEIAKINEKFLYEVETGKKGISFNKMFALSQSLGVSMDYLVTGKTEEGEEERHRATLALLSDLNTNEVKSIETIIRKILSFKKQKRRRLN